MDKKIIEEKAKAIIIKTLGLAPDDYDPDGEIVSDPLGIAQLCMQLEFAFGIEIDDDSFVKLTRIKDILAIVNTKMGV